MNEHYLKISDSAMIEHPLQMDMEYQLTGIISTYGADKRSNNDGEFKYTYKAKFTSHIALIQGEKVITAKDKSKASVRLRRAIEKIGTETGEEDLEEYYQKSVNKIISKLEDIL